ncbi:MAG: DotU family type IV/VI secretion system protein [Polyangiaceae bacterium]|nr:DotU family type IV/VI secretion system protein [Polyangiaceae bacterium]
MAPMYWACSDVLDIAAALPAASKELLNASNLRGYFDLKLREMAECARAGGVVPEDIVNAQYALVALLDEQLARAGGRIGRPDWQTNPLQFAYFGENTAGENFFRRMYALESQPHRIHVLQIYWLCMAVGFRGRYAIAGASDGNIAPVYNRVATIVARASGSDVLSPHGEATDARGFLRREKPLIRIGLGVFGLALVVFLIFKVVLVLQVRDATQRMHDYADTTAHLNIKP